MKKFVVAGLTSVMFIASSTQLCAANKDDMTIMNDVKMKVTTDTSVPTVNTPNVVVDVKDGKVFLYGVVDNKDQKKAIEKAAKAVDGVKGVSTEVRVKGD